MRRMYPKRVALLVTCLLLAACAGCIAQRSEPTPAAGPVIRYLRANVEEADPGDTIVLAWESTGGTKAILYPIPPSGQLPQSGWEVDTTGTYTYKIGSAESNWSDFSLFVLDESGRYTSAGLRVKARCPTPWFFSPAPDGCASDPIVSDAAEQHFEHGIMVWVKERVWIWEKDTFFVLYDDDQSPKWETFSDEWQEGEAERDPALIPPPGLYQPVRGLGLIWRNQPQVRARLGWAVDQEKGFSTIGQMTTWFKYNSIYLRSLDGNVWHLGPERSKWEKILVVGR